MTAQRRELHGWAVFVNGVGDDGAEAGDRGASHHRGKIYLDPGTHGFTVG
ncbi:MAG: hypothetical protein ACXVZX_16510 [Terriglobales bacterium]